VNPPTRMEPVEDAGDIFTPSRDDHVAKLGEIAALRALTDQVSRMGLFLQKLSEKQDTTNNNVADLRTDVALIRQQDEKILELRQTVQDYDIRTREAQQAHDARIRVLELADARLSGAKNGFEMLRNWGPPAFNLILIIALAVKTGILH
jgi:hypothetical protein